MHCRWVQNTPVFVAMASHAASRNYNNPAEQRQMWLYVFSRSRMSNSWRSSSIRILYMPPVYAIISFFSYRYFRDYTYYSLIEVGVWHVPSLILLVIDLWTTSSFQSTRSFLVSIYSRNWLTYSLDRLSRLALSCMLTSIAFCVEYWHASLSAYSSSNT